jgi:hypothetical protein
MKNFSMLAVLRVEFVDFSTLQAMTFHDVLLP